MKVINSTLFVCLLSCVMIVSKVSAQSTHETIPNNSALVFSPSSGTDDSKLYRGSGGTMQFHYYGNFTYKSKSNGMVRIQDSMGNNNIEFDPDGKSFVRGGNFGIGLDYPASLLHVKGTGGGTSGIEFSNSTENFLGYFVNDTGNADYIFTYENTGAAELRIKATGDVILAEDGNVGIGQTNPNEALELKGNILIRNPANNGALILSPGTNGYGAIPELYIQSAETGSGNSAAFHISRNASFSTIGDQYSYIQDGEEAVGMYINSSDFYFRSAPAGTGTVSWTNNMKIEGTTGNVGIGTDDTFGYKLAVNGTIGAKEVKVELSSAWPDYVFGPEYDLTSLEETSQFISENGHLPNIPSAEEVEANGISLGEMNAKLLEKIEELTLHQIEQQKTINQLVKEIETLKSSTNE